MAENYVLVNIDPKFKFKITCKTCGSENVRLSNSLGWSPDSGGWGDIALKCDACNAYQVIYELDGDDGIV